MAKALVTLLTHHADKAPSNSTHFLAVLFGAANDVQAVLLYVCLREFAAALTPARDKPS